MTKVCMVVHQYYHHDARVRRYAEALVDAGMQVDVLCPRDKDHPSFRQERGVRIYSVPLRRGYRGALSYLGEYAAAVVLFTIWLLALHLRNRYQVIHIHNMPDFLVAAGLVPKLAGAKVILDIHDPMPEFYMSKYEAERSLVVRCLELQEQLSSKVAHAVIAANERFRERLIKRGTAPNKITVIRNFADLKIFDRDAYRELRQLPRKHFTLLYPGTIAPRYGLDIPIRALPYLLAHSQDFRLHLVGPYVAHVDELLQLARDIGVDEYVSYEPSRPVHTIARLMASADVGIYTARPGPHMSIATPTKVLEYAVMGVPIIASRLKVLEDIFPESAILYFEPGNTEQFAECVLHLYKNPHCREQLVEAADRLFVQRHSWSHERNTYLGLLKQLRNNHE